MTAHLRSRKPLLIALATLTTCVAMVYAEGPIPQASKEHETLRHEVGTWDADSKFWLSPESEPILSKAVETNKMLGSMWLVSDYESTMMGMPFVGHGQMGYDPQKKKYVGTWIDTASPFLSVMEGTLDEKTNALTMMSTGINPMTGKAEVNKMVSTLTDADHKTFEIFGPVRGEEGKWWKKMEIKYTRRK